MNFLSKINRRFKNQNLGETLQDIKSIILGGWYSLRLDATFPFYVMGKIKILKKYGTIQIGKHTRIWKGVKFSAYGNNQNQKPRIIIGRECSIGDRTEIHAAKEVLIGNRVIIAWDCVVMDRDYHPVSGEVESVKPVLIEDGVWIGCRAIILKGIKIGQNAVIGAGSVVVNDIPEDAIAVGNPARIVGNRGQMGTGV
jgi:acetyltransferase-like isoleucine patch superfamily enzyme